MLNNLAKSVRFLIRRTFVMKSLVSYSAIMLGSLFLFAFADNSLAIEKSSSWWKQAFKEAKNTGYSLVSIEDVKKLIQEGENFLLIDVRPDYEYLMGHLPGAINLEFHLGNRFKLESAQEENLKAVLTSNRDRKVIIYCRSYS